MADCEIDYCEGRDETTLTVQTDEQVIKLSFCRNHADALEARLSEALNIPRHLVNLRTQTLPGTIGDITDALDYLDEMEERKYLNLQ